MNGPQRYYSLCAQATVVQLQQTGFHKLVLNGVRNVINLVTIRYDTRCYFSVRSKADIKLKQEAQLSPRNRAMRRVN